jgi:hypothetical protein
MQRLECGLSEHSGASRTTQELDLANANALRLPQDPGGAVKPNVYLRSAALRRARNFLYHNFLDPGGSRVAADAIRYAAGNRFQLDAIGIARGIFLFPDRAPGLGIFRRFIAARQP